MNSSVQQLNFEFEVDIFKLRDGLQYILSSDDPKCMDIKQQLINLLLKLKGLDISFNINMPSEQQEESNNQIPGGNVKQEIDLEMLKNVFGQESKETDLEQENFGAGETSAGDQQQQILTQQQFADEDIVIEKSGKVLQEKSEGHSATRTSTKQSNRASHYLAQFQFCAETCRTDHQDDPISCVQFCPNIQQLDSEYGWLISSSKNLLNLWRCEPAPVDGESDPLQIAHSQMTSYSKVDLDIDAQFGYVFAACQKEVGPQKNKMDSLAVFSLSLDHLLAEKGSLPLQQDHNLTNIQQVCSLNSLEGKLSGCVAIASGPTVSVAKLGKSGKLRVKAGWTSHKNEVCTQLYLSQVQNNTLISGSSNGVISLWDMKDKPDSSLLNFCQHGSVSGLQELGDGVLLAQRVSE
eukprot:TRINITY_DN1955_c1_g3_i4.p1 TRINITY_DN1955_c1_g3~~TRINITY_DN1955_c1_g3_i4.p1  ORF type:complete len:407 (+),score=46.62 TRINITY_DN1955_c1_g3_i4:84-1304(+)